MAVVISTLANAVSYINTLYESDSTAPSSGDEDYTVWTALLNVAVNIWEHEEGVLWNELFVKLADAADGDTTTAADDTSYVVPTDFAMPACGYVWLGTGTDKTAYKVIKQEEAQLRSVDSSNWCYFLMDGSPTLEFNPNLTIVGDYTINYEYYKTATKLSATTDTFDMADPMFAVYFVVSELKKDEGDTTSLGIATQKLEAMRLKNVMPSWFQVDNLIDKTSAGFGT